MDLESEYKFLSVASQVTKRNSKLVKTEKLMTFKDEIKTIS